MSARAAEMLDYLSAAESRVVFAPVLAVRMSRADADCREFVDAFTLAQHGLGGYDVPRDAPHIRRRARANRKRNKAAHTARRRNR